MGLSAGAGADVRLGSSVFLTPNLDVLYQYFPAGQDPSLANVLILATLGLTFHCGGLRGRATAHGSRAFLRQLSLWLSGSGAV